MTQLDLFTPAAPPAPTNPFTGVQGVNLFGQRGMFTDLGPCVGCDLVRTAYCGEAS